MLLHAFVLSIPLKYLLNHCLQVCEIIVSQGRPVTDFEVFGTRLLMGETPEDVRPQILRLALPYISRFEGEDFMKCCVVWSKFTSRYFSTKEICDLCEQTLAKLRKVPNPSEHFADLTNMVENVMECRSNDLSDVLKMKPFIDILDYVRDEPYGSKCAKAVLTAIVHTFQVGSVDDAVLVDRIVEQCSRLCLSVRPDSIHDEVQVVDRIVSSALDRPMMTDDPERYLAFLVRARSMLYQSDDITAHILMLMVSFALQFYKDRPSSSRKASFMR
ncbi:hypothetical protein OESDEN_16887 [Oesophagostomum dentatum]|uniref:Uncharacterized protein n=1 Tax=Oesophagostomum dentatum TaxID=61180 RepID=A0A0B1SHP1_OESDE|nr:hypothetical protein OESDEN_16887 [Oesophagostomum dentatum]